MRNIIWILFLLVMYGCSEERVNDNSDENTGGNKNNSGKDSRHCTRKNNSYNCTQLSCTQAKAALSV